MVKTTRDNLINRELSWLEFNFRVLEEARCQSNPLLERLKFFCIVSTNLDEFFEVRVAGLKQQIESGDPTRSPDGLTPTETLQRITTRTRELLKEQQACWHSELVPQLAKHRVRLVSASGLDSKELKWVEEFYRSQVRPVLTPLGNDPSHPFPQLLNKSLNLVVELEIDDQEGISQKRLAVVQLPRVLPRMIRLPSRSSEYRFMMLGNLIVMFLSDLFPGTRINGSWRFRVTRNSELFIDEDDASNLLSAVENELHNRRKGAAVRLEVETECPEHIRFELLQQLGLQVTDLYPVSGPLNPSHFMSLFDTVDVPELRYPRYTPQSTPLISEDRSIFDSIAERDILLHHPYESFDAVARFLQQASEDPNVLAIKQTLYRTGGDEQIVGALMNAVRNGKQVTAVVELKARFDEANNILWARRLEEAGVHVLYGLVGYKIHGKMCLVVRREGQRIRRYLHLSTGNYNPTTSRFYTDVGLFTANPDFAEDATNLFNLLTGICKYQETRQLLVAPFRLHQTMLELIQREIQHAQNGLPARIIAKMNALVDPQIIQELYCASQAGVEIDLLVRGICCLRPGIKGFSDRIRVRSIVDRFLEHSRIFCFLNAHQTEVYVGSADWMPRNFFKRIEVVFPIRDGVARQRIIDEILEFGLQDNDRARLLSADGVYKTPTVSKRVRRFRSQWEFMKLALKNSKRGIDKAETSPLQMKLRPRPGVQQEP